MLTMNRNNYITDLSRIEGLNISEIHRLIGHSRDTIRVALNSDFSKPKSYKQRSSILDPFKLIVDEWLHNDVGVQYKQRHTANRVYSRLVEEHGYIGGLRTVEKYVKLRKKELNLQGKEAYLQLKRPPEEAQVDFGKFYYFDSNHKQQLAYHLVVAFPTSNAEYVQVFQGENQQCLFEGLNRIFERIGGVPKRIVFDNMSTAVAHVGKGKQRILTDEFLKFKSHYGFQPVFCNPASGNEKSHAEIHVGYVRRNAFVPIPTIHCFNQFNLNLFETCNEFNERNHYTEKVPISTLFKTNLKVLLPLPHSMFVPRKFLKVKSNRNGHVRFEKTSYSVSPNHVECELYLEISHDEVVIMDTNFQLIDCHKRDYIGLDTVVNWHKFLPLIQKKPSALKYTGFYELLNPLWHKLFESIDYEQTQELLSVFGEKILSHDKDLLQALQICLELNDTRIDTLKMVLRKVMDLPDVPTLALAANIPVIESYITKAEDYNDLMGENIV